MSLRELGIQTTLNQALLHRKYSIKYSSTAILAKEEDAKGTQMTAI